MMRTSLRALIELIDDLVSEGKSWKEKRDQIVTNASHAEMTHIEEFSSWFIKDDEGAS